MAVTQRLMTAEEFAAMSEIPGKRLELVRGEVIAWGGGEVPTAGALHGVIVLLLARLIDAHALEHHLGYGFADGVGYVIRRDPDTVRVPDVSFVAGERVPESGVPEGFWPFAPDLAVEVVSPGDRGEEIYEKVDQYLSSGTRAVWIVWPKRRVVSVHTPDSVTRELRGDDELDGGDVLPGFRVRVADLFAPRR